MTDAFKMPIGVSYGSLGGDVVTVRGTIDKDGDWVPTDKNGKPLPPPPPTTDDRIAAALERIADALEKG